MMKSRIYNVMDGFRDYLDYLSMKFRKKSHREEVIDSLKRAQEEMKAKEKYFDHATDPDLVDFAIYDMEASKRKYSYLLKKIKNENNM